MSSFPTRMNSDHYPSQVIKRGWCLYLELWTTRDGHESLYEFSRKEGEGERGRRGEADSWGRWESERTEEESVVMENAESLNDRGNLILEKRGVMLLTNCSINPLLVEDVYSLHRKQISSVRCFRNLFFRGFRGEKHPTWEPDYFCVRPG